MHQAYNLWNNGETVLDLLEKEWLKNTYLGLYVIVGIKRV